MHSNDDGLVEVSSDVEVRFMDLWIPAQRVAERWIDDRHYSLIRWSGGLGHERLAWYDDSNVRVSD